VLLIAFGLSVGMGVAFGGQARSRQPALTAPQAAMLDAATAAKASGCGVTIASHVYHPDRLTVYSRCISVTGTIVDATHGKRRDGVRREKDGDTHGWLKPDPKFSALVNSGNTTYEEGNLVFEIVCYWKPTQADAISACPGTYTNKVIVPPIGSHVEMTGAFVRDENHARWMEIHPVTKIRVLP
jgi:hypothetical protein